MEDKLDVRLEVSIYLSGMGYRPLLLIMLCIVFCEIYMHLKYNIVDKLNGRKLCRPRSLSNHCVFCEFTIFAVVIIRRIWIRCQCNTTQVEENIERTLTD